MQNPPWGNHRAQGHRSIGHKGTKSNRNSELNLHLLQRPGQSPGLCTTSVFILESNAFGQYAWNSIRRAANAFAALVLIDRIVLRANGYRPLRYNPYCPLECPRSSTSLDITKATKNPNRRSRHHCRSADLLLLLLLLATSGSAWLIPGSLCNHRTQGHRSIGHTGTDSNDNKRITLAAPMWPTFTPRITPTVAEPLPVSLQLGSGLLGTTEHEISHLSTDASLHVIIR